MSDESASNEPLLTTRMACWLIELAASCDAPCAKDAGHLVVGAETDRGETYVQVLVDPRARRTLCEVCSGHWTRRQRPVGSEEERMLEALGFHGAVKRNYRRVGPLIARSCEAERLAVELTHILTSVLGCAEDGPFAVTLKPGGARPPEGDAAIVRRMRRAAQRYVRPGLVHVALEVMCADFRAMTDDAANELDEHDWLRDFVHARPGFARRPRPPLVELASCLHGLSGVSLTRTSAGVRVRVRGLEESLTIARDAALEVRRGVAPELDRPFVQLLVDDVSDPLPVLVLDDDLVFAPVASPLEGASWRDDDGFPVLASLREVRKEIAALEAALRGAPPGPKVSNALRYLEACVEGARRAGIACARLETRLVRCRGVQPS